MDKKYEFCSKMSFFCTLNIDNFSKVVPATYEEFRQKKSKNMTEKVRKNKNPQYFFENEIGLYYEQFDVFCNIHSGNWAVL